jgi:hypothetical protein
MEISAVACALVVLFLQLALSVKQESQTWDEGNHIFAGYRSWTNSDFGLNPEHPPLVKLLATAPLLSLPLQTPKLRGRDFKLEAFLDGKEFLYQNDADLILFRTRMAAASLTLLLALLVFLATKEMFGTGAAFVALTLLVFEPNLLAHGAVVTTDAGLSCFMFATVYAFYRYVKTPSVARLITVGLAAGLALAAKHTGLLVFPMLILLALCEVVRSREVRDRGVGAVTKASVRLTVALVITGVIAVGVLWAFYEFRYDARPAGLELNPSLAVYTQQLKPREAKTILTFARWHLLPESYLYGLTDVRAVADSMQTYILGTIDGPVLISAGTLSGFEMGPGLLNPYDQFQKLQPSAVIQYGIMVFDGHFNIPLASALAHEQHARELLAAKQIVQAQEEVQAAIAVFLVVCRHRFYSAI